MLWLWFSGCGISLGLFLIPALSPTAASFQDHSLDLKISRIDRLKQGPLLCRLLALERGQEGSIQIKLSSTKGNGRGQSANKSVAATLPVFMKISLMAVLDWDSKGEKANFWRWKAVTLQQECIITPRRTAAEVADVTASTEVFSERLAECQSPHAVILR